MHSDAYYLDRGGVEDLRSGATSVGGNGGQILVGKSALAQHQDVLAATEGIGDDLDGLQIHLGKKSSSIERQMG